MAYTNLIEESALRMPLTVSQQKALEPVSRTYQYRKGKLKFQKKKIL